MCEDKKWQTFFVAELNENIFSLLVKCDTIFRNNLCKVLLIPLTDLKFIHYTSKISFRNVIFLLLKLICNT